MEFSYNYEGGEGLEVLEIKMGVVETHMFERLFEREVSILWFLSAQPYFDTWLRSGHIDRYEYVAWTDFANEAERQLRGKPRITSIHKDTRIPAR